MTESPFSRRINFQMADPDPRQSVRSLLPPDPGPRPTLIIAAAVLAAMLCLALFRCVILLGDMAGLPVSARIGLIAHGGFQDMLVLSLLGGIAFGLGQLWRPLLVARVFRVLVLLLVLWGATNVVALRILAEPVTWAWITYADIFGSTYALDAIGHVIDAKLVASLLGVGLGFLLLQYLLLRLMSWRQTARRTATGLIALPVVIWAALIALTDRPAGLMRGEALNPAVAFVQSVLFPAQDALTGLMGDATDETLPDPPEVALAAPVARPLGTQGRIRNVILVVMESTPSRFVDDYGGVHGITPNLTRFRDAALRVERVYAPTPASNYALFALTTSVLPEMRAVSPQQEYPDRDYLALPDVLAAAGFRTGFFASTDNRFDRRDRYLPHAGYQTVQDYRDWTCDSGFFGTDGPGYHNTGPDRCTVPPVLDWIDAGGAQPFFATFWTGQPHYPYFVEDAVPERTGEPDLDRFLAAVSAADNAFGLLMDGLAARDLLAETLVVVVGDHGEAFGEHGTYGHAPSLYEENLRVPLYLINPGLFEGEEVPGLAVTTDVPATILDLLRLPRPAIWQGRSLFDPRRTDGTIFFSPWNGFQVGFVEGHRKVIHNASTERTEIYDLATDPGERMDLAPDDPEMVAAARAKLSAWLTWQAAVSSRYVNAGSEDKVVAEDRPRSLSLFATGTFVGERPMALVSVDAEEVGLLEVTGAISNAARAVDSAEEQTALRQYFIDDTGPRCARRLRVEFVNDAWAGEGLSGDTNLTVKWVEFDGVYYMAKQFTAEDPQAGGYWNDAFTLWRNGSFWVELAPPSDCISDSLLTSEN